MGASLTLLTQRRSPTATLAWIFAFVALPVVSGIYYVVFGPRRLKRRKLRYGTARKALAGEVSELPARNPAARCRPCSRPRRPRSPA